MDKYILCPKGTGRRYIKRTVLSEAVQWFKHGDHPLVLDYEPRICLSGVLYTVRDALRENHGFYLSLETYATKPERQAVKILSENNQSYWRIRIDNPKIESELTILHRNAAVYKDFSQAAGWDQSIQYGEVWLHDPSHPDSRRYHRWVKTSDWIVQGPEGLSVYSNEDFVNAFEHL